MSGVSDLVVAEMQRVVEENAQLLREAPSIGIHVLRDGRVRVYSLDLGWRRRGYIEYRSDTTALWALKKANQRARHVSGLLDQGVPISEAVRTAQAAFRVMSTPLYAIETCPDCGRQMRAVPVRPASRSGRAPDRSAVGELGADRMDRVQSEAPADGASARTPVRASSRQRTTGSPHRAAGG